MPRGLENWLAIGFAGTMAPLLVSGCIQAADPSYLSLVGFGISAVIMVLALGLMLKNGFAASFGKWLVLLIAISMLGMGGYELYQLYGANPPQKISPLPDAIVTVGWLFGIFSPWIAFLNLNGRNAQEYFAAEA